MENKDNFLFNCRWRAAVRDLAPELRLEIYEAVMDYAQSGVVPEMSDVAMVAFSFIRQDIDRQRDNYEEVCRKRQAGGRKGGNPNLRKGQPNPYYAGGAESNGEDNQRLPEITSDNLRLSQITSDNLRLSQITSDKQKEKEIEIETDIYIPPTPADAGASPLAGRTPEPPARSAVPYRRIVEMWNATCTSFPRLMGLSEKRRTKIGVRWKEMAELGDPLDILQRLFDRMQESRFLQGDNRRGWKANFDWLMHNGENWRKVMEGNYDRVSEGGPPGPVQPPNRYDILRQQQDEAEREAREILRKRYEKSN